MTTTRPMLTVKAAMDSCQVSEKTLRRRLPALQEHGAVRDDDGQWRIPIEALEAVGFRTGKPKGPDRQDRDQGDQLVADQVTTILDQAKIKADQDKIAAIEKELERANHRAELAEQAAAERDRTIRILQGNVEDLRRQLEPGKSSTAPTPTAPSPTPTAVDADAEPAEESSAQAIVQPVPPATAAKRGRLRRLFGLQERT